METNNLKELYKDDYFEDRFNGVDKKREESYVQEYNRIIKYVQKGKVLDIGCGMGNFLNVFDDNWEKYGIEISEFAAKKAQDSGINIIDFEDFEKYFDLIIFRGVIQHLDTPFLNIQQAIKMLKPDGYIVFLATPNSNSLYYKFFNTLPMLDPERNFLIPSDITLEQILKNLNMNIQEIHYPYLQSPYSNPITDHFKFLMKCFGMNYKFAFWKNSMELYAKKKDFNA